MYTLGGVIVAELGDMMGSVDDFAGSSMRLPRNMMPRRDVEEPRIRRLGNSMLLLNLVNGNRDCSRTNSGIERSSPVSMISLIDIDKGLRSIGIEQQDPWGQYQWTVKDLEK